MRARGGPWRKTQCGGITGASCNSRSHVCIDNPDDNCDPAKGGADCSGCCVFDLCQKTECHKGDVCKLNAQGEPECVRAPCKGDTDCAKDEFCRQQVGGNGVSPCLEEHVCVKKVAAGAKCGGFTLPCFQERCQDGLRCEKSEPTGDAPGTCVPLVCDGKTQCGGITGASCNSRSHVCIDNPDDNCDPAKGGADCSGCCVFDLCQKTECHKGDVCKLNAQGEPECVCEEGTEWKQDCNTCACRGGKAICTEIACETGCKDDKDCAKEEFCKQDVGGNGVSPCLETKTCVKREVLGASCGGRTLPCFRKECQTGLRCHTDGTDRPGTCVEDVVVPPTCTPYTKGTPCIAQAGVCYNAGECTCGMFPQVKCFADPCETATCRDGFECKSSYCGGCNHQCVKKEEPVCTVCGGIAGLKCPGTSVCKDDPRDDCDPAKGGADCSGCCEPVVCCQAVPTCPAGFEQTEEAACTKQMWDSKICVREAMCCKEIVCRTYIK